MEWIIPVLALAATAWVFWPQFQEWRGKRGGTRRR